MNVLDMGYEPHQRETWSKRYGELMRPVSFRYWDGASRDKTGCALMVEELVPAMTTVKIVMVSRFGDVGITKNLDAETGYQARIAIDDIANLRETPEMQREQQETRHATE